jgi:predicted RNA-binding protein with PUA-like domain
VILAMASSTRCWLVKSEPDCFSIHDLAACPRQTTCWSGVRNYQARNFMRDQMHVGDRVLFYHSSTEPPAVAGTAVVARAAYPDFTAWDKTDDHFDPKASPQNPIWQMVDIRLDEIFGEPVPLSALRSEPALREMQLLRQGSRLSVQPVRPREYEAVVALAHRASKGKSGPAKKTPGGKSKAPKRKTTAKRKTAAKR